MAIGSAVVMPLTVMVLEVSVVLGATAACAVKLNAAGAMALPPPSASVAMLLLPST